MSATIGNILAGVACFGLGFTAGLIASHAFPAKTAKQPEAEPIPYGMGEPPPGWANRRATSSASRSKRCAG